MDKPDTALVTWLGWRWESGNEHELIWRLNTEGGRLVIECSWGGKHRWLEWSWWQGRRNWGKENSQNMTDMTEARKKKIYIYTYASQDPSIHFLNPLNPIQGRGGAGAYPSCHWARGGVHPGQVTSPSQGHTESIETHNHARLHRLLRSI